LLRGLNNEYKSTERQFDFDYEPDKARRSVGLSLGCCHIIIIIIIIISSSSSSSSSNGLTLQPLQNS